MSYDLGNVGHVYVAALALWGESSQLVMAMEKGGEFIRAVSHEWRYRSDGRNDLIDAIADMEIMCDQMKVMFHLIGPVDNLKIEKIKRLAALINASGERVKVLK